MNVYVLVEGEIGERYVYEYWIPLVNPKLRVVDTIFDLQHQNFAVFAGAGYPQYNDKILKAIQDINSVNTVDRFVIAVDSENLTYEEKYSEIKRLVANQECSAEIRIVVQHFCLEAWALGNRRFGPRNPKSEPLITYRRFFDVFKDDPELLPEHPPTGSNRAQFALSYLRAMLLEKRLKPSYSKSNPRALLHKSYFEKVKERMESTGHIASFQAFLDAFTE